MVSVVIPYHNSSRTIKQTLYSVACQTYRDVEVIIIDDMSKPDERAELVAGCYDTYPFPLRIIKSDDRLGAAGARNLGIREASGEYIAFLDSDDFWERDKLDKQIKVMERFRLEGEAPVICFTGRRLVSSGGKYFDKTIGCDKIVDYDKLLLSNQINCSSVLIRKDTLEDVSFPDGKLHEDYALWLSILKRGGYAAGINRPLLNYRLSPGSRSGNKLRSAIMTYRVYRFLGIPVLSSAGYMVSYTVRGLMKYLGLGRKCKA